MIIKQIPTTVFSGNIISTRSGTPRNIRSFIFAECLQEQNTHQYSSISEEGDKDY